MIQKTELDRIISDPLRKGLSISDSILGPILSPRL